MDLPKADVAPLVRMQVYGCMVWYACSTLQRLFSADIVRYRVSLQSLPCTLVAGRVLYGILHSHLWQLGSRSMDRDYTCRMY